MITTASRISRQGFSLVEVVIAVAVAGLFLIGITGLLGTGLGVSQTSSAESRASGVMTRVINDLQAMQSNGTGYTSPYYQINIPTTGSSMTSAPKILYVTDQGDFPNGANTGLNLTANPPTTFRVTVGFQPPAAGGGSQVIQARIMVTWPAAADQSTSWPTKYAGSLENVVVLNPAQTPYANP